MHENASNENLHNGEIKVGFHHSISILIILSNMEICQILNGSKGAI